MLLCLDKMDGLRGISKENKTKGSCKSGDIEGSNSDNDSVVSDDDAGSGEGRSSPKMTSSNRRETIEDFLSSCGSEYYQRSSATATGGDKSKANGGPAKKRVSYRTSLAVNICCFPLQEQLQKNDINYKHKFGFKNNFYLKKSFF